MSVVFLIPVVLSSLLLAAHFLRSNSLALTAISLIALSLLFIRRRWAATVLQVFLLLGAAEWLRTLLAFIEIRQSMGQPWTRLLLILGGALAFTALASLLFETPALRQRYAATPQHPTLHK